MVIYFRAEMRVRWDYKPYDNNIQHMDTRFARIYTVVLKYSLQKPIINHTSPHYSINAIWLTTIKQPHHISILGRTKHTLRPNTVSFIYMFLLLDVFVFSRILYFQNKQTTPNARKSNVLHKMIRSECFIYIFHSVFSSRGDCPSHM